MKQSILIISIAVIIGVCVCFIPTPARPTPEPAPEVNLGKVSNSSTDPFSFIIYYNGVLYDEPSIIKSIPKDALLVGTVTKVTDEPNNEFETNKGDIDNNIYVWTEDGITYIGLEIVGATTFKDNLRAYTQILSVNEEEVEKAERRKKWFSIE